MYLADPALFAMLAAMYRELLGSALVALVLAAACGGSTGSDSGDDGGSGGSEAGSGGTVVGGTGGAGSGGTPLPDAGVPPDAVAPPLDATSDYDAPVCPDVEPPPLQEECDLFGDGSDCAVGLGCFPYVEYPDPNDDCAQERFGTYCLVAGSRLQGEPCDGGDCAENHLCVLTGDGTICVQLCSTRGGDECPAGLLCEPIDVQPGVGGCY